MDRSSSVSCSSSGSRPSSPSRSPSPSRPSSPSRSPTPAPRPSKPSTGPCLRSGTNCGETVSITSFEVELGSDGSSDPVTARVKLKSEIGIDVLGKTCYLTPFPSNGGHFGTSCCLPLIEVWFLLESEDVKGNKVKN